MADSYYQLEIYQKSMDLFYTTHRLSHTFPKSEVYELGSQIRRSCDGINSNIVEGYGRKRYKADFIKFLSTPTPAVMKRRTTSKRLVSSILIW